MTPPVEGMACLSPPPQQEEQARWHGQLTEHAGLAQRQELALQRVAEELQGSRAEATRLRQRLAELEHRRQAALCRWPGLLRNTPLPFKLTGPHFRHSSMFCVWSNALFAVGGLR